MEAEIYVPEPHHYDEMASSPSNLANKLTMLMEMKTPGVGVLEFDVEDKEGDQRTISVRAFFHPAGVWGILYWFALLPFYAFIFRGMTRVIAEWAEAEPAACATVSRGKAETSSNTCKQN